MPPTVEAIPPPETREIIDKFLASRGVVPVNPTVRSSDFSLVDSCPFTYLLTRRLGLCSLLAYSEAFSRGSWFHAALELTFQHRDSANLRAAYNALIDRRVLELKTIGSKRLGPAELVRVIDREKTDAQTSLAWFLASQTYTNFKIPSLRKPWPMALTQPPMMWLGSELVLRAPLSGTPKLERVIQLDALLYNQETNALWVLDAKTTSLRPWVRAQQCPYEPQTFHYLDTTDELLPSLKEQYSLPKDCTLGGMIHLIVAKPSIEFGQSDRQWWYAATSKRSDIRATASYVHGRGWTLSSIKLSTGELLSQEKDSPMPDYEAAAWCEKTAGVQTKKEFSGEPDPLFYQSRCASWYCGTGDYTEKAEERMEPTHTPINYSFTSSSILLDTRFRSEYAARLDRVLHYARSPLLLENFPRTPDGIVDFSREPSVWARFFGAPVQNWPALMVELNLIQKHR